MRFRNVDVDTQEPVETWPQEALQAVLERGSLVSWRRIAAAIRDDPWGPVARGVEEVLGYSRPYGVAEVMTRVVADAREACRGAERQAIASELSRLVERSGFTQDEFASRLGTSASRFSNVPVWQGGAVRSAPRPGPAGRVVEWRRRVAGEQRMSRWQHAGLP